MENRLSARAALQFPCKARFQLEGQSFTNISIVNLGSHGCCFVIPEPTVNRFNAGPILEGWKLIHPRLPRGAIKAKVVWCRSQGKARPGFMEAGVQFLEVPPDYIQKLNRFLDALQSTPRESSS